MTDSELQSLTPRELLYLGYVDNIGCPTCGHKVWPPVEWSSSLLTGKGGAPDCYHTVEGSATAPSGYVVGETLYCSAHCAAQAHQPQEEEADFLPVRSLTYRADQWANVLWTIVQGNDALLSALARPIHHEVMRSVFPDPARVSIGFLQPQANRIYQAVRRTAEAQGVTEAGA